jgi:hypothetical protein
MKSFASHRAGRWIVTALLVFVVGSPAAEAKRRVNTTRRHPGGLHSQLHRSMQQRLVNPGLRDQLRGQRVRPIKPARRGTGRH